MNTQRYLILFLLITLIGFFSCKEDEPNMDPLLIVVQGEPLLSLNGSILFSANKDVDWFVVDSLGGTIDANGIYKAPNKSGAYRVTAISREDGRETSTGEILVTAYKDEFIKMRRGGYAIYFRHAIADSGSDMSSLNGPWWKSCSVDSARQLSAAGQLQALQLGTVIRKLNIPVSEVFASEYCRCYTTAEIMNYGHEVQTVPDLTFLVYDESTRHQKTLDIMSKELQPTGQNAVFVSHSYGPGFAPLPQVSQGDMAVFVPIPGSDPRFEWYIPAAEITALYRKP